MPQQRVSIQKYKLNQKPFFLVLKSGKCSAKKTNNEVEKNVTSVMHFVNYTS